MLRNNQKPILKTPEEIEQLRRAAQLVSKTLAMLAQHVRPGVTTGFLDRLAETFVCDHGAIPAFKGYRQDRDDPPFPGTLCTSVNEVVVHGIPSDAVVLKEGDIVSLDCGVILDGFVGDSAYTFAVGEIDPKVRRLLEVTKESLYEGIAHVRRGGRVGDISYAIQSYVESRGFYVVRELTGHGLGRSLHEPPQVPNYGRRGNGQLLPEGTVICIEPMINLGTRHVVRGNDGWAIIARDRKPSAHYEHTVAIGPHGAEVLTTFEPIESQTRLQPV